jgi:hypothetical protein
MNLTKSLSYASTPNARAFFTGQSLHPPIERQRLLKRVLEMLPRMSGKIRIKHFEFENTRGTVPYYHFARDRVELRAQTVEEMSRALLRAKGRAALEAGQQVEKQLQQLIEDNQAALETVFKKSKGVEIISLK